MNAPVRAIQIGDYAPTIRLPNQRDKAVWAYDTNLAGHPVIYLIVRDATSRTVTTALEALRDCYDEIRDIDAHVIAITNLTPDGNKQLIEKLDLYFSVLSDPTGFYASSFNLSAGNDTIACAVVDRNCRLLKLLDNVSPAPMAQQALKICQREVAVGDDEQVGTQAPVLLVPRVFEPDFCKKLIKYWRQGEKEEDQITRRGMGNPHDVGNDDMKRRTDVRIPGGDDPLNFEVSRRLSFRVMPELEKVFNHKSSKYELARVGCYESSNSGFFRAHRDLYHGDNETPRRFAMSLNLNDGFEGGGVRFPEYSMKTYTAPLGGGLVFSCKLLHEVLPITKGKRFAVFLFFN